LPVHALRELLSLYPPSGATHPVTDGAWLGRSTPPEGEDAREKEDDQPSLTPHRLLRHSSPGDTGKAGDHTAPLLRPQPAGDRSVPYGTRQRRALRRRLQRLAVLDHDVAYRLEHFAPHLQQLSPGLGLHRARFHPTHQAHHPSQIQGVSLAPHARRSGRQHAPPTAHPLPHHALPHHRRLVLRRPPPTCPAPPLPAPSPPPRPRRRNRCS